jgi:hypothetical protein
MINCYPTSTPIVHLSPAGTIEFDKNIYRPDRHAALAATCLHVHIRTEHAIGFKLFRHRYFTRLNRTPHREMAGSTGPRRYPAQQDVMPPGEIAAVTD